MKIGKQFNICFETSTDEDSSDESSYGDEESYTSEESSMELMGLVFQQAQAKGSSMEVEVTAQEEPMLEERLRKMLAKDLTKEEEEDYINIFKRYPHLFITDYSMIKGVDVIHHINLKPDAKPIAQKLRRLGVVQQGALLIEHRSAFQRGGPCSVKLEDSEPCKITPCKIDSYLDGEKDEAPISLDCEDSKELSMQDLDSTEVEKKANIGGEEETRLHEQQERIRGDLIVAGYTLDEALKALNTLAKVQEHEEITSVELGTSNTTIWGATSVKPTTKTTVQELTFVELSTSNTTVWEATSVEPTTKTTVQEHEVTAAATSAEVTTELEHKATTVKEHKATSSSSIAEEHNVATVEAATVDKLEEATPDIDGDNLKLSSFIPAGFKMRKSCSRPTHNGFDLVHLPKTRYGSK
ncbi:hypothetical protein L7F22_040417 [Adiantum nelumboides]|nr:hypothetical protein [Adiantum nelumboides]